LFRASFTQATTTFFCAFAAAGVSVQECGQICIAGSFIVASILVDVACQLYFLYHDTSIIVNLVFDAVVASKRYWELCVLIRHTMCVLANVYSTVALVRFLAVLVIIVSLTTPGQGVPATSIREVSEPDEDWTSSYADSEVETLLVPKVLFMRSSELQGLKLVSRRHLLTVNAISQWTEGWLEQPSTTDKNDFTRSQPITIDIRPWHEIMLDFESAEMRRVN
jgi:hypothetical protein